MSIVVSRSAGSVDGLGAHGVALSTTTASSLGMRVGAMLDLRLGDGAPTRLRIVATYARGLGFGDVTLPYALLAAHVDNPAAATVLIAAPATARPALHALAAANPAIGLSDRVALAAQPVSDGAGAVRSIALGLIIAFTAISVVNTLAIATIDRRRELALLHRVGATRGQLLRVLRAETLTALITALFLGGAIGTATLSGFAVGITGSPLPTVTVTMCLSIGGCAALLTYLGTALPARAVMRAARRP